ncbi:MAG: hypothetical protein COB04_04975 [Gammaproteobacteria bacterium]|nr:MAG: hypothetical protein COB04_04975 [Gammaproteobacteria bacterium]
MNPAISPSPQQQQLQQLHDIHLPAQIGQWPPAIGWWFLALLVIITISASLYFGLKRYRHHAPRRQALNELQTLRTNYVVNDSQTTLKALSELLKRVALSYYPRNRVAKLSDQAWLEFLDQTSDKVDFQSGPSNALVKFRYQASTSQIQPDVIDEIFNTCKQWIKSQK